MRKLLVILLILLYFSAIAKRSQSIEIEIKTVSSELLQYLQDNNFDYEFSSEKQAIIIWIHYSEYKANVDTYPVELWNFADNVQSVNNRVTKDNDIGLIVEKGNEKEKVKFDKIKTIKVKDLKHISEVLFPDPKPKENKI